MTTPHLSKKQISAYRTQLKHMLDELDALSEMASESRKPVTLDQTSVGRLSRMDALQGQAMQLETERRRGSERQRIHSALARIEDGEFGYCITCGDEIAPKRLAHDPSVATCVDCAGA